VKREREKDADARARKNREREKTQIYPAFPSHARVSLSLQKKSARKKGRMKIWRLQLYVYLFFIFRKCSRSKNARAVERLARTRNRSERREIAFGNSYLARINRVFFLVLRGKSRRERLLNYAHTATFLLKKFFFSKLTKRHRHFFFPERAHVSLSKKREKSVI
jgi:hypothetical protein